MAKTSIYKAADRWTTKESVSVSSVQLMAFINKPDIQPVNHSAKKKPVAKAKK